MPGTEEYEDDGYWRGPIWAPSTVLIENGLRRSGFTDLAYTWTASSYLHLAREAQLRGAEGR